MKNVTIFPGLVIKSGPSIFNFGKTVEIKAHDYDDLRTIPRTFKFVYEGNRDIVSKFPIMFKAGDVVNIQGAAESYKGKVYGKRGKSIKYPDGSQRFTTKTRFRILKIFKGVRTSA